MSNQTSLTCLTSNKIEHCIFTKKVKKSVVTKLNSFLILVIKRELLKFSSKLFSLFAALQTIGVEEFNKTPPGHEMNKINKPTFIFEA